MEKPTNNASGCPAGKARKPLLSQTVWRLVGGGAIGAAALLAWFGADAAIVRKSVWHMAIFAGLVLTCLCVAGYTALLDIRYIRLQYALARRQAFLQTLGEEGFRKALRAADGGGSQAPGQERDEA